ncbi:hypothetical protein SLH46_19515 [Draconibacterium sp. IB214405]|uniref:dioxygenase family protein n=1 Tax=Draconibacterium sp. IB214405 TaxID=3097352 RepID=UPI002A1799CD|nr:hypothetical protein [Draconibacterium sp. IB214405]MDX8341396.1 hypothetical protein [Draconibacterium sp. IB214405]
MDRNKFLRKSIAAFGTIVALPTAISACSKSNDEITNIESGECHLSPSETAGPFPIKSPADLARANIISDRTGVALLVTLTVVDQSNSCASLADVYVDLWHCDADGNYSQYGGIQMQQTDYTDKNFLRGRQTTDSNGQVSFISIFPGWYPSRAPHIHIEVLDNEENSLRVTQIAFPKEVCDTVYASTGYNGEADTQNESDNVFANSIEGNMLDSITGNTTDGYTLLKTIVV